jgi:L-lactate dehydrogenase complex protein LldE
MNVGLFVPCYIDAFFPEVGIATLELLERLGCSAEYPLDQTCCGQPMANSGCLKDGAGTEELFVNCFKNFDTIVGPSGCGSSQTRSVTRNLKHRADTKCAHRRSQLGRN